MRRASGEKRFGRGRLLVIALGAAIGQPVAALAHAGAPLAPHDVWAWSTWNVSPVLLGGLVVFALLYGRGVAAGWRKVGRGHVVPVWRVLAFAAGLLVLGIALISPLDALAEALFSAHMMQHLLLVLVAAPLLVAGAPPLPLLWSLPGAWRPPLARCSRSLLARSTRRTLTDPVVAVLLHLSALWLWHVPLLYEAALRNEALHVLEHATLLGTAILFWWVLIQPVGRRRSSHGAGVLIAFAAALQGAVLGALIAFADTAWYRAYAASVGAWGLSPLDDQRLAGSIMMLPTGVVYLIAALVLLIGSLNAAEQRRKHTQADWVSVAFPTADASDVPTAGIP